MNIRQVRIPQIGNIETALKMFYEKTELRNSDIKVLFPGVGNAKVTSLKAMAREVMEEDSVIPYDTTSVNTDSAFKAWGIDPEALERRLKKLRSLKLISE